MDQQTGNFGNDVMLTMGSDFEYSNAAHWYINLDKLIDHVNKDGERDSYALLTNKGRVNVFYSTPSEYVKAKQAYNATWSVKTDDFFPYSMFPTAYWTGYFASRPALKKAVRVHSTYLNTARQLEVFGRGDGSATTALAEPLGLAQHHDAVSGTSKQHVAYDYVKRLSKGRLVTEKMVNSFFSKMVTPTNHTGQIATFTQCGTLNETFCELTQSSKSFVVTAYNPLGRSRVELIQLPVSGSSYVVFDATGRKIESQTEPSFVVFPKKQLYTPASYVLYFQAHVPALGFTTYFVQQLQTQRVRKQAKQSGSYSIHNDKLSVIFDINGQIQAVTNKRTGVTSSLSQNFMFYTSVQNQTQNSGAYIMRTNEVLPHLACAQNSKVTVISGPVMSEVRTVCGVYNPIAESDVLDWLAQTVRIAQGEEFIEFEFQTGQIPISDAVGKELITKFSTSIKSKATWYTDSNGREFQQRIVLSFLLSILTQK